jgi:serine-type D-Ala-D-Ala carboxypeptidase (penicillin-binding protein 5/6)
MFAGLFAPATAEAQLFGRRSEQGTGRYDASAWVIADSTTGVVLDSSNASRRLQVGSITKIATAMVLLDWVAAKNGSLSELATVPDTIAPLASPNSIGLQTGDRIALRDALYAAMMQSDNQAAETIAVHVGRRLGGGESDHEAANFFVAQMNALARKLGMRSTRFLNAHGLDDLEKTTPYSTAGDIALLANYAVGHSGFTFYTSQKDRKVTWTASTGELASAQIKNTNELLGGIIDGMKTGTTRKAGPCLVATAAKPPESRQEGEQTLITPRRITVVVLGSPTRFDTTRNLLNHGWGLLDEWAAAGRPLKGWRSKR